jgi:hypothetical protein
MQVMEQAIVKQYLLRLYGNCSVGTKEGVVRTLLGFLPGSTVFGAALSAYLLSACRSSTICSQCGDKTCPVKILLEALRNHTVTISHFVPIKSQGNLNEYFKYWFNYWFNIDKYAPNKKVDTHIAINRILKSVLEWTDETDLRGILYGDEVWKPPSNEFYGYVTILDESLENAVDEVFSFLNVAQIGGKSKYCFVEIVNSQTNHLNDLLKNLQKKEDTSCMDDSREISLIAPVGLVLTKEELTRCMPASTDTQHDSLRISYGRLRSLSIQWSYENLAMSPLYFSLYDYILDQKNDRLVMFEPGTILISKGYKSEWCIRGHPELKLSSLGWNILVPVNWVRAFIKGE